MRLPAPARTRRAPGLASVSPWQSISIARAVSRLCCFCLVSAQARASAMRRFRTAPASAMQTPSTAPPTGPRPRRSTLSPTRAQARPGPTTARPILTGFLKAWYAPTRGRWPATGRRAIAAPSPSPHAPTIRLRSVTRTPTATNAGAQTDRRHSMRRFTAIRASRKMISSTTAARVSSASWAVCSQTAWAARRV